MSNETENNKRIAKNTVFLYFRMFVMVLINFYTARIVLQTLGVSDFGVYNVMGGIIGMLGYANTLLAGGTSRFLTIKLGEGDLDKLKNTFSTTLSITMLSALVVLVIGESVGLWFVNAKLNIDASRMDAANWIYQCTLISSCLTIIQSPFTATVISHEKMSVYAYMSLLDGVLKLLIAYALLIFDYDKLKIYGLLLLAANVIDICIYRIYCHRNFEECSSRPRLDRKLFKQMFSYSSWNMVGGLAGILANYGVNIITNLFFGTAVNAARGIANQVSGMVSQFYSNFQMASNPQIVKYYAQKDLKGMFNLAINTSKYSAFLILCVIIPLGVNVEGLLSIWLHEVPEFTADFIRCTLLYSLIIAAKAPLGMCIHAIGKMKIPNLTTALINMCVFPATYLAFKYGGHPALGYIIHIISSAICMIVDLWMVRHFVNFPVTAFIKKSIVPILLIALLCPLIPFIFYEHIGNDSFINTLTSSSISFFSTVFVIFFLGLNRDMQKRILKKMKILR